MSRPLGPKRRMTANDLYCMLPERSSCDLGVLLGCFDSHLPEFPHLNRIIHSKQNRVEIRFIKNYQLDDRRIWRLATVWFDGSPVMVIQNGGKEGDDFQRRFVTDQSSLSAMVGYLFLLLWLTTDQILDVIDPDIDEVGLTDFNHLSLAKVNEFQECSRVFA